MGPEPPPGMQPVVATKKGSVDGRLAFQYKGRTVYEWEQNLEEVHVYITPPPGVRAKMLDIGISPTHLKIGIKGNPPFINVRRNRVHGLAGLYVRVSPHAAKRGHVLARAMCARARLTTSRRTSPSQ